MELFYIGGIMVVSFMFLIFTLQEIRDEQKQKNNILEKQNFILREFFDNEKYKK